MSLPIVVVFERHWDVIPKELIKELLPDLADHGYDTFCVEAPQDLSVDEMISAHVGQTEFRRQIFTQSEECLKKIGMLQNLAEMNFHSLQLLLQNFVTTKRYQEGAIKIKELPAALIQTTIFNLAKKYFSLIKGIDINLERYRQMFSDFDVPDIKKVREKEEQRINTLFNNLLELKNKREGLVFVCGVLHATNLMSKFRESNLKDNVIYYFPHSSKLWDESVNDIELLSGNIKEITYPLEKKDILQFKKIIIENIVAKSDYKSQVVENSHVEYLKKVFAVDFKTYFRSGYFLDALTEPNKVVEERLREHHIFTRHVLMNQRKYLVISNVNTRDVAEKLHQF